MEITNLYYGFRTTNAIINDVNPRNQYKTMGNGILCTIGQLLIRIK